MSRKLLVSALILCAGTLTYPAVAPASDTTIITPRPEAQPDEAMASPGDMIGIGPTEVQGSPQQIRDDFQSVMDLVKAGKWRQAATALRRARARIEDEIGKSLPDERQRVRALANALDSAATTLKAAGPLGSDALTDLASRSEAAIVAHHLGMADLAWAGHDAAATGGELKSALLHLTSLIGWVHPRLKDEHVARLSASVGVMRDLLRPEAPAPENARVISALGDTRDMLGIIYLPR